MGRSPLLYGCFIEMGFVTSLMDTMHRLSAQNSKITIVRTTCNTDSDSAKARTRSDRKKEAENSVSKKSEESGGTGERNFFISRPYLSAAESNEYLSGDFTPRKQQFFLPHSNNVRNSSGEQNFHAGHGRTGPLGAHRRVFVNEALRNGRNGNASPGCRRNPINGADLDSSNGQPSRSSKPSRSMPHVNDEDQTWNKQKSVATSSRVPRLWDHAAPSSENLRFPLIYVTPMGNISLLLNMNVIVEVSVDRAVRVVCHDNFSVASGSRGASAAIHHPTVRILQSSEKVFCSFGDLSVPNSKEKFAVLGPCGVLFTMSHLLDSFLVSSAFTNRIVFVPVSPLCFPQLDYDFTLQLFYLESRVGEELIEECQKIAQQSHYGLHSNGCLALTIKGIYIRQYANGDVEINSRPRHILCSPSHGTVRVRTSIIDMAVEDDDKAYVRLDTRRVHVSRSGTVVSDANCVATMDHKGRIISVH